MNERHRLEQISRAIDGCAWLAPVVKAEVLRFDWTDVTNEDIERLLRPAIALAQLRIEAAAREIASFPAYQAEMTRPGSLEARLPPDCEDDVLRGLVQLTSCVSRDPLLGVFLASNLSVCVASRAICAKDEEALSVARVAHVWEELLWHRSRSSSETVLGSCARFLDVDSVFAVPPEELAKRLGERIGDEPTVVRCGIYRLLIQALYLSDSCERALAVADGFIGSRHMSEDGKSRASQVTAKLDRLQELAEGTSHELGPDVAQMQVAQVLDEWALVLGASWRAAQKLRDEAGDVDEPRFIRQCESFDAFIGWKPNDPFDWNQLDFIVRNLGTGRIHACIGDWFDSLAQRNLFDSFCGSFSQACRQEFEEPSFEQWWDAPGSTGRTVILSCILVRLWDRRSRADAGDFFNSCFPNSKVWLAQIARLLSTAPNEPARRALMPAVMFFAASLYESSEFSELADYLSTALPCRDDTEGLDDVIRRCASLFGEAGPELAYEQLAYCFLSLALFRTGYGAVASTLFSAAVGYLPFDPDLNLRRLDSLGLVASSMSELGLTWALVFAEYNSGVPWLRSVLQTELGIPDLLVSPREEVLAAIDEFVSQAHPFLSDRAVRLDYAAMLGFSAQELRPSIATDVIEQALGIHGVPNEALCTIYRPEAAAGWFLCSLRSADSYLAQRRHERFLAIVQCYCPRNDDGTTVWAIPDAIASTVSVQTWNVRNAWAALTSKLLEALRLTGRHVEACEAAAALVSDLNWMEVEPGTPDAMGALFLAFEVARYAVDFDTAAAEVLHLRSMEMLEGVFRVRAAEDFDRLLAAARSTSARRSLVEFGNSLALAADEATAERTRTDHLENEAWLTQRTLLLRFLEGAAASEACGTSRFADSDDVDIHSLLQRREALRSESSLPLALDQLIAIERREISSQVTSQLRSRGDGSFNWDESVSSTTLAHALGQHSVLLRAGFTLHGQIVWSLYRAEDEHLILTAHDEKKGSRNDRERIVEAQQRFDRRTGFLWDLLSTSVDLRAMKLDRLRSTLLAVDAARTPRQAHLAIEAIFPHFARTKARFAEEFLKWGEEPAIAEDRMRRWRSDTFADLDGNIRQTETLRAKLDEATESFLNEVDLVWPWSSLCDQLRLTDELVIWAEDALLGIPFAFLRDRRGRDDRFLFERVDCIRSIISPVLDEWMQEEDRSIERSEPACMASLSAFGGSADEQFTELELVQAFANLKAGAGRDFHWKMAGGPTPVPGTYRAIEGELSTSDRHSLALLAVCGHGCSSPNGVIFTDAVWDGSSVWSKTAADLWEAHASCDLSAIDFLVQISCSIGRLKQDGLQDVEGFCAELFLNRCRSVFAGRWILHSLEAIRFCQTVCEEYLKNYSTVAYGSSPSSGKVRGRAVAAARTRWKDEYREGGSAIGINTVAAMDLYGRA